MPVTNSDIIIAELWAREKHKYPHITYEQFIDICKAPFHFTAKQMAREDIPTIHIKYFGKFKVFAASIQSMIVDNRERHEVGEIDDEIYTQRDKEYRRRLIEILKDKPEYTLEDEESTETTEE